MTEKILGNWTRGELLACIWDDDMAARFPTADHTCCRMQFGEMTADGPRIYAEPICISWHCNRCGKPTDCQGGHDCPDRPA